MKMKNERLEDGSLLGWRCLIFLALPLLYLGCTTTDSGTTNVTGQLRPPVDESYVDLYQDPPGLLAWIPDMEIPTTYEQVAQMELSGSSPSNQTSAIENTTYNLVYGLKRRAAKLGANAIIIREVKISEEVVEQESSPYRTVRYPDGSIGEVEVPVTVSYKRVFKVTVLAESVFLDWNNI